MTQRGGGTRAQRNERRAQVEERLVHALKQLIETEPRFTEITLARLLTETGVSRTSFYKYFDSKTDVLAAWFRETINQLIEAPRPHSDSGPPARQDLEAGFAAVAAAYRRELPLMAAVYETAAHDYDMRQQLTGALDELEGRVRRHLVRGQRAGWVNPSIDPRTTGTWIVALAENGLRHIIGPSSPDEVGAAVGGFVDIVWFTAYASIR